MYVTRALSLYRRSPEALFSQPPEGPNSGYLVLQDEESTSTVCFGLCNSHSLEGLPLPQNKRISVRQPSGDSEAHYPMFFIPVINQPLSSSRYYVIKAYGNHEGEAYASSKEEDKVALCFCCRYAPDQQPRALDPLDSDQQFEILHTTACGTNQFSAKSVTAAGIPPGFLRTGRWEVWTSTPKHYTLGEAAGLNSSLRHRLPDLYFPSSPDFSEFQVVGKWYCPFMFVKEWTPKEQMKKSMFYEVTLEQRWERIFCRESNYNEGNIVPFDVIVPTQVVTIAGREAVQDEKYEANSVMWFKSIGSAGLETGLGLSSLVFQRMIWEQERFGWVSKKDKQARVAKVEEYGGIGPWRKFGCYVLVERFVFKRMDGSSAITFDFKHIHQIKVKWE
ncbi:hypothetical protein Ancab_020980 [Ancistrocladus abbreviatus]